MFFVMIDEVLMACNGLYFAKIQMHHLKFFCLRQKVIRV